MILEYHLYKSIEERDAYVMKIDNQVVVDEKVVTILLNYKRQDRS